MDPPLLYRAKEVMKKKTPFFTQAVLLICNFKFGAAFLLNA